METIRRCLLNKCDRSVEFGIGAKKRLVVIKAPAPDRTKCLELADIYLIPIHTAMSAPYSAVGRATVVVRKANNSIATISLCSKNCYFRNW